MPYKRITRLKHLDQPLQPLIKGLDFIMSLPDVHGIYGCTFL